jgi:hypothetical protein
VHRIERAATQAGRQSLAGLLTARSAQRIASALSRFTVVPRSSSTASIIVE